MAALANILEILSRIDSSSISVHQERCALVRNRNSGCTRCADACTSGCISFTDHGLEVDATLCVGCGTCATACPTGALEARNPTDEDVLGSCANAMKRLSDEVVFVCSTKAQRMSSVIDPEKCVIVPCLGRIEETLLTTIACAGAKLIVFVHDRCQSCSLTPGKQMAQEVASTARELMRAWSIESTIEISDDVPIECHQTEGSYDSNRRGMFSDLVSRTKSTTRCVIDGEKTTPESEQNLRFQRVMEDGTLPHFVPERRKQLIGVLAGRGEPDDIMVSTRLWGHVLIDAHTCSSCRMCATFCPTGAISKYEQEDGSFGVEHAPSACVKCRICENICPEKALSLSDEVFAVDLIKGVVERYPMKMRPRAKNQEEAVRNTMRNVLGSERIY